jgi:hypothetical protein
MIDGVMVSMIDGVMVSMFASSAVEMDSNPVLVKPKTIKLVFAASHLSTQH